MAENAGQESRNWWLTLPGVLTAVAALITAVGGLVVALHQAGVLGKSDTPAAAVSAEPPAPAPALDPAANGGTAAPTAPAGSATVGVSPATGLSLVSHSVEPRDSRTKTLRCRVRMLNDSRYPANFSDRSFRLIVDGLPHAPANMLNDVVAEGAFGEGELLFVIPASTSAVILRMQLGDDVREHALTL